MKLIDLHVHSNASDGSLSPAQVVALAEEKGLTAIALTDHDTAAGIDEALQASEHCNLEVIPGIEISCTYLDKEIHILGLFIDHKDPGLASFLKEAAKKRANRNKKILEAFQEDGFSITMEDLLDGNEETTVTRAHFARALQKKGYVSTTEQAFKKYLNPDRPYYRKRETVSPAEGISAIRAAGGFPVLAHPCLYALGWKGIEELIEILKPLGLRGLECFHSSNNQNESGKLLSLARTYGLCPTGGSDFHGKAKPDVSIGSGRGGLRVSALFLDELRLAMFLGA